MLHPPKQHVLLEFLGKKRLFISQERELRADTAHNKWLKQALFHMIFYQGSLFDSQVSN